MKAKTMTLCLSLVICISPNVFAQIMPKQIKNYLNKNYRSWKLSPSEEGCGSETNNGIVKGNFNGDRNLDYAIKFTRGKKGFIIAFLAQKQDYKPFILHDTDAEDVKYLSLWTWKKGEVFELENKKIRLKYDAPADYRCESDVGGIHYYRNGKFIAY
jgi:hypothetical protein